MPLRVVAVAAPHLKTGVAGGVTLGSSDPASLFNACRMAGLHSRAKTGVWSHSNWTGTRVERRRKLLLMRSWEEDLARFQRLLETERPNLLLLGAMTLCMPGAIECARLAREILGDQVCVVLGGKHVGETIYRNRARSSPRFGHHPASPLKLMENGVIPPLFDVVVAGEAEALIVELGAAVTKILREGGRVTGARVLELAKGASGDWIAGAISDGMVRMRESAGRRIHESDLPSPASVFGITASFPVFGGRLTGHAFSDSGPGCPLACEFCSESRKMYSRPLETKNAARRLYSQLSDISDCVLADDPDRQASAFVEDSVLLAARSTELFELARLLESNPLDVRFGAQLTLDLVLARKRELRRLKAVGLDYIFVGLETEDPSSLGGMDKDRNRNLSWWERAGEVFAFLDQNEMRCGAALLFGLGESPDQRESLFSRIQVWRAQCSNPILVSLNWAVQHPLKMRDGYQYLDWGTKNVEMENLFTNYFGEASELYPLIGQPGPREDEVREVCKMFDGLKT